MSSDKIGWRLHTNNIIAQLWGGELELVALSRLYNRSIVVYNEVNKALNKAVQEQVFLSLQDEERGCTVDELENPVKKDTPLKELFTCSLFARFCWPIQTVTITTVCTPHNTWTTCHSARVRVLFLHYYVFSHYCILMSRIDLYLLDGEGLQEDSFLFWQEEAEGPPWARYQPHGQV